MACCSSELATSLSRATGGNHFSLDEETLLTRMRELVVRYENPAVQVQTFLAINQQADEGVRHFLSRLKGVATHCDFVVECTATGCEEKVSYADHVIRFKLVSGLVDEEIKEDVLAAGDLTLEKTVKLIESKEGAKKAKTSLTNNSSGQVAKVDGTPRIKRCSHCGRTGHGSTPTEREKSCPAFGKTCDNCGKEGHFMKKCLSRKKKNSSGGPKSAEIVEQKESEAEADVVSVGELAGVMCAIASVSKAAAKASSVKVPHMLYDHLRWVKQQPSSHPMINVEVSIAVDGYKEVGAIVPPATRRRTADIRALADTGCQACCIGERQLNKLGLIKTDLLQPALNLRAANASGIDILGATFVTVAGKASTGELVTTKQTCYIVKGLDHMLLSKDACQKLGIIPSNFPSISVSAASAQAMEVVAPPDGGHPEAPSPCRPKADGTCSCPKREKPPPPPVFDPSMSVTELHPPHLIGVLRSRCLE